MLGPFLFGAMKGSFKDEMGMSMMEYVKERKLICASYELTEGKK